MEAFQPLKVLSTIERMEGVDFSLLFNHLILVLWRLDITRLGCLYVAAIMSWGWDWADVEIGAEVDLRLRGSSEVEVSLSLGWGWSWVEI